MAFGAMDALAGFAVGFGKAGGEMYKQREEEMFKWNLARFQTEEAKKLQQLIGAQGMEQVMARNQGALNVQESANTAGMAQTKARVAGQEKVANISAGAQITAERMRNASQEKQNQLNRAVEISNTAVREAGATERTKMQLNAPSDQIKLINTFVDWGMDREDAIKLTRKYADTDTNVMALKLLTAMQPNLMDAKERKEGIEYVNNTMTELYGDDWKNVGKIKLNPKGKQKGAMDQAMSQEELNRAFDEAAGGVERIGNAKQGQPTLGAPKNPKIYRSEDELAAAIKSGELKKGDRYSLWLPGQEKPKTGTVIWEP